MGHRKPPWFRSELLSSVEARRELFRRSWLLRDLDPKIVDRLLDNRFFMINGGLFILPAQTRVDWSKEPEMLRACVAGTLAVKNELMRLRAWVGYKSGFLPPNLSALYPEDYEEGALVEVHTKLLSGLLKNLGRGLTIEELARKYLRPPEWGLEIGVPRGAVEWYINYRGNEYHLETKPRSEVEWGLVLARDPAFRKLTEEDLEAIERGIIDGSQPRVRVKDIPGAVWGVDLTTLKEPEINALAAEGAFCHPDCRFYHANPAELKQLGKLIAPVDAEIFGGELTTAYREWLASKSKGTADRFGVLIPAQADETTFEGIYLALNRAGVDFSFFENSDIELADLCVTPLLRVYETLGAYGFLGAEGVRINVRSMDAFRWGGQAKRFHFICTDHFIELFPLKSRFSQKNLLVSLVKSLAPRGKIVLTTRCGTEERPLTESQLMRDFYKRADQYILQLLASLEGRAAGDLVFAGAVHDAGSHNPFRDARTLLSLLHYRKLREVHPFRNERELGDLLTSVKQAAGVDISFEIERLEEGKVKLVITRQA